jgi:hypothetical protein
MSRETIYFVGAIAVGVGATLFMDLWALFLKRALRIPSPDYCMVGRWLCHMPEGTFKHSNITTALPKRSECTVGWVAHYVVGVAYALTFVVLVSDSWLARPTLLPALLFGVGTVLAPFLLMQPSYGFGIAASKTPDPARARARSLIAHTAFGVGLYLCGVLVSLVLAPAQI